MYYYLNYFYIFSFLGFLMETFLLQIKNSGVLYGWWTPIYGVGIIIILLVHKCYNKLKINKYLKGILLFLICAILLGTLEYTTGYILKEVFDMELWNYEGQILEINKFTTVGMSLLWGFGSIIYIYVLKPIMDKFIIKIPKSITLLLTLLFIVDVITTALNKF